MKPVLCAAILAVLSTPAAAEFRNASASRFDPGLSDYGRTRTINTESGRIRTGAPCEVAFHGIRADGRCTVGRGWGSGTTLILAGTQTYAIVRDPYDNTSGTMYRVTDGARSVIGSVNAVNRYCWVGSGARFCAK